ncbi:B-cell antigen receptor complex-associated protein beta chain [Synchiropus picturatus]
MRWLLVGVHGFIFIHFGVTGKDALFITQKPRFYGVRTGQFVYIICQPSLQHKPAHVQWYKASEDDVHVHARQPLEQVKTGDSGVIQNAVLFLNNLEAEDTGVYFCRINSTWGFGTGLQVARPLDRNQAAFRSSMKDGFIILQALLLTVCAVAFLHHNRKLLVKHDIEYEEPEVDHIYEGLAIESRTEELYEELPIYDQMECTEVPWGQN